MPEGKKVVSSKVSERSTKQEMWEAYNKLLEKVEREPIEFHSKQKEIDVHETLKSLSELKLKISRDLDKIGEEFLKDLNDMQDYKNSISKNKQLMIDNFGEQQNMLEKEMKKMKEYYEQEKKNYQSKFDEELRQKTISREREDDEYSYNLSIKHRDELDEFNRQKYIQEEQLKDRRDILESREKEIKEMEKEVTTIPEKINQSVKEAKEILTKEMLEKFSREKYESKLAHDSDVKIKELKITNLENAVKMQNTEIEALKRQLLEANRQLKEMAVSVIEGRSGKIQNQMVDKS